MEMKEIAYEEKCPTTGIGYNVLMQVPAHHWQEHLNGNTCMTAALERAGQKKLEHYFKAIDQIQLAAGIMVVEDEVDCSVKHLYDVNA